ncbi:MAG: hypothetical protein GC168_06105 [Candidatus Hydrogenedens sp.]|nr:hypothetical protein [Candidatus Hydrogenedens sp.]
MRAVLNQALFEAGRHELLPRKNFRAVSTGLVYNADRSKRFVMLNTTRWMAALAMVLAMVGAPLHAAACACGDACAVESSCSGCATSAESSCCSAPAEEATRTSSCCDAPQGVETAHASSCHCSMKSSDGADPATLPDRNRSIVSQESAPLSMVALAPAIALPAERTVVMPVFTSGCTSAERCTVLSRFRC